MPRGLSATISNFSQHGTTSQKEMKLINICYNSEKTFRMPLLNGLISQHTMD